MPDTTALLSRTPFQLKARLEFGLNPALGLRVQICRFKNKIHTGNMEILKFGRAAQFLIHPVCRVDDVSAASKIAPAIHASRPTCCFRNAKISLTPPTDVCFLPPPIVLTTHAKTD